MKETFENVKYWSLQVLIVLAFVSVALAHYAYVKDAIFDAIYFLIDTVCFLMLISVVQNV